MLDTYLRALKDRLLYPLVTPLAGVSPLWFTALALVTGLLCAGLAAAGAVLPSVVMWWLSRLCDGLDGLVARRFNKQSDLGGYLDIVGDFVVYAAVPLGLTLAHPSVAHWLALALTLSTFYVNAASWMYLAAILEKRALRAATTQTSVVMPAGLVGATESILAYSLFLLWPEQQGWLFAGFAALVAVTIGQRLRWAWRHLSS